MARFSIRQNRPFLILFVLVPIWLLIPPAFKRIGENALYEFQAPIETAASQVHDLASYWSIRSRSRHDLITTGRELSRLASLYRIQAQENQTLREFNARLRDLLDIPAEPGYDYEIARVVRRDINAWWHQITIRKGALHGLEPGQGVVYSGGVVGRVREVYSYTAVVDLITSPSFRMAAHFTGDSRPVRYSGTKSGILRVPDGRVSDVPSDLQATPGTPLTIVSSRLGGVFPDGLRIGTVQALQTDSTGLFQEGAVELSPRLLSLEEVSVLVPRSGRP